MEVIFCELPKIKPKGHTQKTIQAREGLDGLYAI